MGSVRRGLEHLRGLPQTGRCASTASRRRAVAKPSRSRPWRLCPTGLGFLNQSGPAIGVPPTPTPFEITDRQASNVNNSADWGLQADNYRDNKSEFIPVLAANLAI